MTATRYPRLCAAMQNMRPSWPPPSRPSHAPGAMGTGGAPVRAALECGATLERVATVAADRVARALLLAIIEGCPPSVTALGRRNAHPARHGRLLLPEG